MSTEKKKAPVGPESVLRRMERMIGGAVKGKKQQAQELIYDAWEMKYPSDTYELLEKAVELDSTNVDAWLGLMNFMDVGENERIEILRKLTDMGRKNLGEKVFNQDKGYFWGVLETRPYMRARGQLALRLMNAGRYEESISEHESMLELNPNDNQGVRYGLMSCYLAVSRLDGARQLFKQYDERKLSAVWDWAYILERFLSGETKEAGKALKDAWKQNPHARAYFIEHRKLPKSMPNSYSIGSREEAVIAWGIMRHAWKKHPEAQTWLKTQREQRET